MAHTSLIIDSHAQSLQDASGEDFGTFTHPVTGLAYRTCVSRETRSLQLYFDEGSGQWRPLPIAWVCMHRCLLECLCLCGTVWPCICCIHWPCACVQRGIDIMKCDVCRLHNTTVSCTAIKCTFLDINRLMYTIAIVTVLGKSGPARVSNAAAA